MDTLKTKETEQKNLLLRCYTVLVTAPKATSHISQRNDDSGGSRMGELSYAQNIATIDKANTKWTSKHLYLVSKVRDAKDGDLCIWFNISGNNHCAVLDSTKYNRDAAHRVVATTDPLIELPLLSEKFVQKFVESQGGIEEVDVELNDVAISESVDNYDDNDVWVNGRIVFSWTHEEPERLEMEANKYRGKVKTRNNNTVTVRQVKIDWIELEPTLAWIEKRLLAIKEKSDLITETTFEKTALGGQKTALNQIKDFLMSHHKIDMEGSIKVGDTVRKISGNPFKGGKDTDEVVEFLPNPQDPKGRMGAKLKDSDTIVNIDLLTNN